MSKGNPYKCILYKILFEMPTDVHIYTFKNFIYIIIQFIYIIIQCFPHLPVNAALKLFVFDVHYYLKSQKIYEPNVCKDFLVACFKFH